MTRSIKIAAVFSLVYCTWLVLVEPWVPVIDDANLVFHEAGHVIFSLFGEVIYAAGGSIFQILLPLLLIIPFLSKQDFFSTTFMLWWAGENMISVGRYIADAQAQALPLLGGEHDWAVILSRWPHVMRYDTAIGSTVRFIGISIMITALCLASLIILREAKNSRG